jgi:hypothetical protein
MDDDKLVSISSLSSATRRADLDQPLWNEPKRRRKTSLSKPEILRVG